MNQMNNVVNRRFSGSLLRAFLTMLFLLLLVGTGQTASATPWWNSAWGYRVRVDVGANGYARYQRPVEQALNFTSLFSAVGVSGTLNESSLRVVEVDGGGNVLDSTTVFQFDKDTDYNATTKASGVMVILMKGTTASGATRHFDVYFDNRSGFTAASFTSQVGVSTVSDWEGQESFKITSTRATYYFHKLGGGFASAIDVNGNDWIGYHPPPSGFSGEWRGIPNMGACAHPGYTNSTSAIASQGPLKITLLSQRNDGKQKWYTAIYPQNVTVTVARSDTNYWFLYEGTPAGGVAGATQFMYRASGEKTSLYEEWSADIVGDEWVYFSDPNINRSLYMIHHESDELPESYWNGGGDEGMTVFGFGRQRDTTEWFMSTVPQTLSFGIMDATDFSASSDTIHAIYKAMSLAVGSAEKGLPSAPTAPTLLAPANSATGVSVPVTFQWNASASATAYRLQVSTESGFVSGLVVDDSTITDTVKSVSSLGSKTTYYWRVAGKNAAGFGSFSSARQFQTALGAPTLVSPANGATAQAIPVTLRWNRVGSATSYEVQVATDASFASGIVVDDAAVTDTTRSVSEVSATTLYYWRVKAKDASTAGSFSANRSFTTAITAPVPVSPANHATDVPLSLTIVWRATPLAVAYHLQLGTSSGFATGVVVDNASITDTTFAVSGLAKSSTYYWHVSAVSAGGEGSFSTTRDFTTYLPPPQLVYPADGAVGIPLTPTFHWNPVAGAVHYWFQLSSDSSFASLLKNDTTLTDTNRTVAGLVNSTRYYWRVAVKTASATSPFSSRWSFRAMLLVPEAVVLVAPANFGQVSPDSVRLAWRKTTTPSTSYSVDVSLDAGFLVTSNYTTTDTVKTLVGLLNEHTYWWRVRGGNGEAWGPYSDVNQFIAKPSGVAEGTSGIPLELALKQNYPNPFNPSTTVVFALPHDEQVKVQVYNALGALVGTIAEGMFPAGIHSVRFDGSSLSSGTYFCRMTAGSKTFIQRMLLLK
jgi:hypothetical protein